MLPIKGTVCFPEPVPWKPTTPSPFSLSPPLESRRQTVDFARHSGHGRRRVFNDSGDTKGPRSLFLTPLSLPRAYAPSHTSSYFPRQPKRLADLDFRSPSPRRAMAAPHRHSRMSKTTSLRSPSPPCRAACRSRLASPREPQDRGLHPRQSCRAAVFFDSGEIRCQVMVNA